MIDHRVERTAFMRVVQTAAGMAMVGMIVFALHVMRDILMPLALATLLSFVLAPLVGKLTKWGAPRGAAVPLVVALAFLGLGALGFVFLNQVRQLAADLPTYRDTLSQKLLDVRGRATEKGALSGAFDIVQDLFKELNQHEPTAPTSKRDPALAPGASGSHAPGVTASGQKRVDEQPLSRVEFERRPLEVQIVDSKGPLEAMSAMISPLLHPLATTAIIVIFVMFILAQREDLRNRFIKLAGSRDLHRTTAALDDAANRLSRLYVAQVLLNAAFGALVGGGLWLIGLPNALLWGVLASVLRFVPYIGAILSTAMPLALAAAVDPGWTKAIYVAALFLITEPIVGHVIEPLVMGKTTGLSPVAIIVAATFWTWLWGPIGLVLSTPLTVCLVVMGKHIEGLRFIDTLLGDQPALSAQELFYQRMLAGDPIEATSQIEQFSEKNVLLDYYDDVALAGLRLAQIDLDRSMLDSARVRRLRSAVQELFAGFSYDHAEAETGPNAKPRSMSEASRRLVRLKPEDLDESWRGANPILVIGGRTPLDEAAAIPMADALNRSGLGARVLPAETLQSAGLAKLATDGVRLIVLSFLDDSSESAMRFATRRLRLKAPNAKILLAVWADPSAQVDRDHLKEATAADTVALTVREAHQLATLMAVTGDIDLNDFGEPAPLTGAPVAPSSAAAKPSA
jgi:predicted PurR-regulated permease PerM